MRVLYFDCFSGVSGDMVLASLLDLGADEQRVRAGLDGTGLTGYELKVEKVTTGGIAATSVTVAVTDEAPARRYLADIVSLIDESALSGSVKERSRKVFSRLAETEARIHNTTPDRVHFHEVGATDSIIDIVGSLLALDSLEVDEICCSPVHLGTGEVQCQHGTLPVPAPATVELLKGVPVYSHGIPTELTTPTGAALVSSVARKFGAIPAMAVKAVGYGAGKKDLGDRPNMLRTVLGETDAVDAETDIVAVLETTIDDMNPEHYPWLIGRLFGAGAKDVYLSPTICKQGRPGTSVVVICDTSLIDKAAGIIFEETSSFGIRYRLESRFILSRESREVDTKWGKISVKIGTTGGRTVSISPEFRDCKGVAEREGVPLKVVYEEARLLAREMLEREAQ
jgi:uncharacterized protein (TIGR00299 family) protein